MMQYTDRHFRYLARCLSRHARLYTEMVVATALLRGDAARFLQHEPEEMPTALQLGGSDPRELSVAARIGEDAGYVEINLNVGCPSDRVQAGRFGACLIAEPALVADCVATMRRTVRVPVTVKTRLGVDDCDSQEHLCRLVEGVAAAGCDVVIVHARKALLNFSPRANREIPPLDYARAYALKRAFPHLTIVVNGGVQDLAACRTHLDHVDGVMLGRAAYSRLDVLAAVDQTLFGSPSKSFDPAEVLELIGPYVARAMDRGTELREISRHWLGLHHARPGAREWRRLLGSHAARRHLRSDEALAEARHFFSPRHTHRAA
jgi:tRNA-dihydrouridine synthase A